jgi:hypothetical protein
MTLQYSIKDLFIISAFYEAEQKNFIFTVLPI